MADSKNSRRAATEAEGSPENVSKNSRRGVARKMGASAGDPSEVTPSTPSKNSRGGTGAKIGLSEVTPSETPDGIELRDRSTLSEGVPTDGKAAATTLQTNGHNSPIAVGGVIPPERQNGHDESDTPDISELSAKVEDMKRQQKASALRGALLVFMPPIVLCIPLVILKGCKLLLLSWWWCFAPLMLWAVPIAFIISIFVQCRHLYRQQEGKDKDAAAQEAERG